MFTRLRIINFQNILYFDEELSAGLNVFTGRSGSGKTAKAIRSFLLLGFNRPTGDRYLYDPRKTGKRDWIPSPTEVTVYTDGKHVVSRIRYSTEHVKTLYEEGWVDSVPDIEDINAYILDGNKLTGFGTSVPDSVSRILNLSYLNFQLQHTRRNKDIRYSQMNPLYLLSMSPSEVGRVLNDIYSLDDIDTALEINKKEKREEVTEVNALSTLKTNKEAELKQYSRLDDLDLLVNELEEKEKELTNSKILLSELTVDLNGLLIAEQEMKTISRFPALKTRLNSLLSEEKTLIELRTTYKDIVTTLSDLTKAEIDYKNVVFQLQNAKDKLESEKPAICPICKKEW